MKSLDYAVTLSDRMSGSAKAASDSLTQLTATTFAAAKANAALDRSSHLLALRQSKDKSWILEFDKSIKSQADALSKSKPHTDSAAHSTNALGDKMHHVVEPAEVLHHAFTELGAGLRTFAASAASLNVEGMIEGIAESMAGLAHVLDLLVPGLGEAVAALVRFGGAAASFVVKGAEMAIEATHAKESLIDMFDALGGHGAGEETAAMLSKLSNRIGIAKSTLAPLTTSFMAMGIEGTDALKKVTLAAVSAQAIMGKPEAAQAFETLTKKIQVAVQTGNGLKIQAKGQGLGSLADVGVRVDEVATRMNVSAHTLAAQLKSGTVNAQDFGDALQSALVDKGAGPLKRMATSFANLSSMWDQMIHDMFADNHAADPFMSSVRDLMSIFSQTTNSGKAMKNGIGAAFTYILHQAQGAILPIKHGLQRIVLASLLVAIQVKKHWSLVKPVLRGVAITALVVAGSLAAIAAVIGLGVVAVALLQAGFASLTETIGEWSGAATKAGGDFVMGFVNGIRNAVGSVVDATKEVGKSAWNGLATFLHLRSPSRLMFKAGGYTSEGFAGGIRAGAPRVASAAREMGSAAAQSVSAPIRASDYRRPQEKPSQGGGQGAGLTIQGGVKITIQAPAGVTHALELTEAAVVALFERLALQQGT